MSQPLLPRNKRKELQLAPEEIQVGYKEQFLSHKGCQALEQALQESGGVSIPGGREKMYRCAAEGLVVDLAGLV